MEILHQAKLLAREYRELTGKPLGVTGEVAEFETARILKLKLAPARQTGYDAVETASGSPFGKVVLGFLTVILGCVGAPLLIVLMIKFFFSGWDSYNEEHERRREASRREVSSRGATKEEIDRWNKIGARIASTGGSGTYHEPFAGPFESDEHYDDRRKAYWDGYNNTLKQKSDD